jgi:hypothetical protein
MLTHVSVIGQAVGLAAVIAGLFLVLPFGWFLLLGGALVVATFTAVEVIATRNAGAEMPRTATNAAEVE